MNRNTCKPLIALTPYHNTEKDELYMRPAYLKAIRAAGGTPVILPLEPERPNFPTLPKLLTVFFLPEVPTYIPSFSEKRPNAIAATYHSNGITWSWLFSSLSWMPKSRSLASAAESSF